MVLRINNFQPYDATPIHLVALIRDSSKLLCIFSFKLRAGTFKNGHINQKNTIRLLEILVNYGQVEFGMMCPPGSLQGK